jgi:O-antigen/teichoic acid export membrane protein
VADGAIFVVSAMTGIILARTLGPDDRGLLAAILVWAHAAAGYLSFALNEATTVMVAGGAADKRRLQPSIVWLTLGLATLTVIGVAPFLPWLLGEARAHFHGTALIYLALFVPLSLLANNLLALDQGAMDFRRFNWLRLFQAVSYLLALGLLWIMDWLSVENAAWSLLLATAVSAGIRLYLAGNVISRPDRGLMESLFRRGLRIHLANLAMLIALNMDQQLLSLIGDNQQLGLYVVALSAAGAAQGILVQSTSQVVLPSFAQVEDLDIARVLKGFRRFLGLLAAANMGLYLLLPWLLPLLYGQDFAPSVVIAQILLLALMVRGVKRVLIYALRARSSNRPAVIAEGSTVAVFLAIAWPAFSWGGLAGLAWALTTAHILGIFVMYREISRLYDLGLRDWLGRSTISVSGSS